MAKDGVTELTLPQAAQTTGDGPEEDRQVRKANRALVKRIRAYSDETGIPYQECINEALEEWVECCMEPRLEALRTPVQLKALAPVLEMCAVGGKRI